MRKESDCKSSGEESSESPSREELIEELKRLDSVLDRLPYSSDLSDMSSYSAAEYQSEFGSWDEALEAAAIDKEKELLVELQRVTDELGKKPSQSEMNSLGEYSSTIPAFPISFLSDPYIVYIPGLAVVDCTLVVCS